jgi:polyisoprenoid-binding protein YceI
MRVLLAALLAVVALPLPAAEGEIIRIDPAQSQASFKVSLRVPIPAEGRFKTVSGEIRQLSDLKQSVHVVLDARELNMSGPPWVQRVTQSPQFLDSAEHPIIAYHSNPFSSQVLISGGEINGSLDIRGVTGDVVFSISPSTCRQPGHGCPILAQGRLNRHDFGMSAYRWGLRDEVQFAFQLKFIDE